MIAFAAIGWLQSACITDEPIDSPTDGEPDAIRPTIATEHSWTHHGWGQGGGQAGWNGHGHHHDHDDGPIDSLAGAARDANKLVGAAVAYTPLQMEAAYADTLAAEFNYVTPENATKWGSLQPVDAQHWSFDQADAIIFGARHDHQQVKGHTLVWHSQLPPFVNDTLTATQLRKMIKKHIKKVVHRYRRHIRAWDVVNEAMNDDGTLRDTVFLRKLGPDYIARAFQLAHQADRNAFLYYNDYGADTINPKSDAIYALVAGLKAAHVPIHGVGFQMHLEAGNAPTTEAMVANLQRFADLGLSVNISELDVRVAGLGGDLITRLAVERQIYHRVIAACVQVTRCVSVTAWGFTDKYSWIDGFFGADDPLPFDEQYARKPAYYGMVDGFMEVPADEPGTAPNLIPNSSFEIGTDGWTSWSPTLAIADDVSFTGARSAVATDRSDTWQGPAFDLRPYATAGRSYDVAARLRIGGAASAPVKLSTKRRCAGAGDVYASIGTATATDTDWVSVTGALALPADCTLEQLTLYAEGPAAGVDLYIDDAAVRAQPQLGPNIIANPGFENGASPWFGFGGPTVVASATFAHGGAQSGYATNRLDTWQGPAYNLLPLATLGAPHQLRAWVRVESVAAATVKATVKATCAGADSYTQVGNAAASDSGWAQLTGTISVPACATLTGLTLYFEGPAAGINLYLDDVSVRRDLATPTDNLVTNPDFEAGAAGWYGFGSPVVTASTTQAHAGTRSGYAVNRLDTWQGPATNVNGLTAGGYQASGWVRLEGASSATARMTAKVACSGLSDMYVSIGSAAATDSGWAQIQGTFPVPDCTLTGVTVYFEGPAAGVNLYVDDVAVRRQ